MTLDQAIAQARAIQQDLDAGRISYPYPEPITRQLAACIEVFNAHPKAYLETIARLGAVERVEMELPW